MHLDRLLTDSGPDSDPRQPLHYDAAPRRTRPTHSSDGLVIPPRPAWHQHAACRGLGPAAFFPELHENAPDAKAVCADCPVQSECLDYALAFTPATHITGIWGGMNDQERRSEKRRRARAQRGAA